MGQQTVLRAYRVALDPTVAQTEALNSHAGASRAAYNYHLAAKIAAHRAWSDRVAELTYSDFGHLSPAEALTAAKKAASSDRSLRFPTYMDTIKVFVADPDKPWYVDVNRYALTSGMQGADRAFKNWLDSLTGRRAGRAVGYPRFHAKGRSRDSFTLYHDVKKPTLRPDGYRRLNLPAKAGGSIRLHGNIRQLARRISKGSAVIQSVTIGRSGHRWFASILAKEEMNIPDRATHRQQAMGGVGVDLGVHTLAALSDGTLIENPKHLRSAQHRLAKASRDLSRTMWIRESDGALIANHDRKRGVRYVPSARRQKAQLRLARLHADVAQARATTQHALTKQLATTYATVAIEDLNASGMSRSARGTAENPGRNVKAKAGLNRSNLDVGYGEIRRQLEYKTSWYGSTLALAGRFEPTSKMCSNCGEVKAKLHLSQRTYDCPSCGFTMDRDVNAARNIYMVATGEMLDDARGKQESQNARGGPDGTATLVPSDRRNGKARAPRAPATPVPEGAGHPKVA